MEEIDYIYFSSSEKGKRFNNEDALLTFHAGDGTYLFAVADGMGENEGGEVASSLALYAMEKSLKKFLRENILLDENMKQLMSELFNSAHQTIAQFIEDNPDMKGMGTTVTALLIYNKKYVWGHIGDSRLYLIKDQNIKRLTRDHTRAEDPALLVSGNFILTSEKDNELTRIIDGGDSKPDVFPNTEPWFPVEKNITWVLCTDGLLIDRRKDFKELFSNFNFAPGHLHCVAPALVKKALKNGSRDNVTVITIAAVSKIAAIDDTSKTKLKDKHSDIPIV